MVIFRFMMLMIVFIDNLKSSLATRFFVMTMMMTDLEHPKIFARKKLSESNTDSYVDVFAKYG